MTEYTKPAVYTKTGLADKKDKEREQKARDRDAFLNPPKKKNPKKEPKGGYVKGKDLSTMKTSSKPKKKKEKNPFSPVSQPKEHAAWRTRNT